MHGIKKIDSYSILELVFIKKELSMKLPNIIGAWLSVLFWSMQVCTDVQGNVASLVTRTYYRGLSFHAGMFIPYWFEQLELFGLILVFILTATIEAYVKAKLLRVSYAKIVRWIFLANGIVAIVHLIFSKFFNDAFTRWFSLKLQQQFSDVMNQWWPLIVTWLMIVIFFSFIKMLMQYYVICHYNHSIDRSILKKAILYSMVASFSAMVLIDYVLYHLVVVTNVQ